MKLAVFDSGVGGEAVAAALRVTFPGSTIHTRNDHENMTYGNKSEQQVRLLTERAIQPFLTGSYDVIILACNTATAIAIEHLRSTYPSQRFIGIEPMIKPAVEHSKSGVIAVYATPATLGSARYADLIDKFATGSTVLEPDCSEWAHLIENNTLNREHIQSVVEDTCDKGADVLVLGCTHYHWIKELITELTEGRAIVLEPSEAIGNRVKQLLAG